MFFKEKTGKKSYLLLT